MNAPFLTVLTPTWNRAYALPELAASLAAQTLRDFEWVMVDDGSTDGTPEVVEAIRASGDVPSLTVLRTGNGGKHRALNIGVGAARGEYVVIVDSDDRLAPDAVERIARGLAPYRDDHGIVGLVGLRADPLGRVIGDRFPEGAPPRDLATVSFVERVGGDKAEVVRLEAMRRYPFPEIPGERFLSEGVVWHRMARDGHRFVTVNDAFYVCEYRTDGLSARSLELRMANPRGTLLYYGESLGLRIPPRALARQAINLVRFAAHAGFPVGWLDAVPRGRRWIGAACLPFGLAAAALDLFRMGRRDGA